MEQLTYKIKQIALLALCLVFTTSAWAGKKEKFEKNISKEFPIDRDGTVQLENKYGDVHVITGNFQKVSIDIRITVNASNQSSADETFNRINVDFNHADDYVSAITTIGEAKKSWWAWTDNGGGDFQIHYDVHMPQSNALQLKNKYGNTYVGEIDGSTNIEVKYGNLKMDAINDHLDLMMGYGNGTIGDTEGISMDVKYSTLDIGNSDDIKAMTKYSKITIKSADALVATTKYDNYQIEQLNSFRNEGKYDHFRIAEVAVVDAAAKYTDFKIDYLRDVAEFDLEYGGADVQKVGSNFSSIDIEGRYTDYLIGVEVGTDYQLDIESDYAGIRYPKAMHVVHHKEEGNEESFEGFVGGKSAKGLIKARLDYGSIKVY